MEARDADYVAFVAAHRQRLLRTAYLLCGSWSHAEDAVQIALAKLYLAWDRVDRQRRGGRGPEAYARQIVARTVVDEWRRPWRRELPADDELMDTHPASAGPDPAAGVDLRRALAALPRRQRQVVVLRHWSGLSVAEVAADLRISEGAVKSHCSRALARLQSLLDDQPAAQPDPVPDRGARR